MREHRHRNGSWARRPKRHSQMPSKRRTRLKEAREAAEKEALEALKAELEAGIPAQSLRRKLSPRVFVIDFDTRPDVALRSRRTAAAPR